MRSTALTWESHLARVVAAGTLVLAQTAVAATMRSGDRRVTVDDRGRMTLKQGKTPVITTSYAGMFGRTPEGSPIYHINASRQLRVEKGTDAANSPRLVLSNTGMKRVTMRREIVLKPKGTSLVNEISVPAGVDGSIDTGFTLNPELAYGAAVTYWPVGSAKPSSGKLGSGGDCLPYRANFRKMVFDGEWGKLTIEFSAGEGCNAYGALLNGARSTKRRSSWVQVLPLFAGVAKRGPAATYKSVCEVRFEPTPGKPYLSPQRNPLYNASFEDWSNPDLPDGWRRMPYATKETSAGIAPDTTTKFEGKRSLRWTLDAGALSHVTQRSGYLAPAPLDAPCVLSAYLRSKPAGVRVRLRLGRSEKTIAAREHWQRHAVVADTGRGNLPLSIEKLSPGTLWLDAVQLEEGREPTRFVVRPRASVVGNTPFPKDCMAKDLAEVEQEQEARLLTGCGPELSYYTSEAKGRLLYQVNLPPDRLSKAMVTVTLRSPSNATVKEAELKPPPGGRVILGFESAKLPVGDSSASAVLLEGGKVLARVSHPVTKRPGLARGVEVKVNRFTRTLVRGGKPYLPVGSDASGSLERALECIAGQAANGLNHLHLWSGFYEHARTRHGRVPKLRPDDLRQILDAAHAAGLTVTVNLSHWLSINHFRQSRFQNKDLTDDELIARSLEVVAAAREHPAVLTWHLCDEPSPAYCTPQWLERAYRAVKEADPYHPSEINVCVSGRSMLSYLGSSDLMSIDVYPVPRSHVGVVAPHTRFMRLTGSWRPIRWWIQSWASVREPSPAEEACMAYQALVEGTRFVLFYNYRPTSYAAWSALGKFAQEVRALTPALLSPDAEHGLAGDAAGRVVASVHRTGNRVYLIAVNRDTEPVDAAFALPEDCANRTAQVMFESRQVKVHGATLRDRFAAMARHVYRIDAVAAGADLMP